MSGKWSAKEIGNKRTSIEMCEKKLREFSSGLVKWQFIKKKKNCLYLPPFTSPFVHIADRDSVVTTHTIADIPMITMERPVRK